MLHLIVFSGLLGGILGAPACPGGQVAAQKLGKKLESNGCTKPAFLTVQGEEDFTYCCDRHDVCYSTCGMTHAFCDDDFKKCMHNLCDKAFAHNPDCKGAASTYSMGTSLFGSDLFSNEQNANCECVPVDELLPHYKRYTEEFYKTYVSNDQLKDPKDILPGESKYLKNSGTETSPKYKNLHKIVYDLHKKYDHAIGYTENRKMKGDNIPTPHRATTSGTTGKKEF